MGGIRLKARVEAEVCPRWGGVLTPRPEAMITSDLSGPLPLLNPVDECVFQGMALDLDRRRGAEEVGSENAGEAYPLRSASPASLSPCIARTPA